MREWEQPTGARGVDEAVSTTSTTERRYEPTLMRDRRVRPESSRYSVTAGADKECPQNEGDVLMNTRTIAIVALIIAVIVLLLLLL